MPGGMGVAGVGEGRGRIRLGLVLGLGLGLRPGPAPGNCEPAPPMTQPPPREPPQSSPALASAASPAQWPCAFCQPMRTARGAGGGRRALQQDMEQFTAISTLRGITFPRRGIMYLLRGNMYHVHQLFITSRKCSFYVDICAYSVNMPVE